MPPRSTINQLPDEQFQFVIEAINRGQSDRQICLDFETQFGTALSKGKLDRWRAKVGDDLAEQYRLSRYQATQLLEHLDQTDVDKFTLVMSHIEDHLLTVMRQITSRNPLDLLAIRQREGEQRVKERMVQLKRKELAFEQEREQRTDSLVQDRLQITLAAWRFIVSWITSKNPEATARIVQRREQFESEMTEYFKKRFSRPMEELRKAAHNRRRGNPIPTPLLSGIVCHPIHLRYAATLNHRSPSRRPVPIRGRCH
jgi:hypothetical protein